jgi:hypothetical protein
MQAMTLRKDRSVFSAERALHNNKTVTAKQYLVMSPREGSTPRLTDLLTVSRNVTSTPTLTLTGQFRSECSDS